MARKKSQSSYDGGPVGYKKPPAAHQFKKGDKKPADSGRKSGVRNARTIIEEMLEELVTVTLGGKTQTMSKRELLIRLGFEKAIKANSVNEMVALLRFLEKLAPGSMDPPLPLIVHSIPGDDNL